MGSKKKKKKNKSSMNQQAPCACGPTCSEQCCSTVAPTFIGLLNAIAVAETEAECYLLGWASTTKNAELAATLRFVAMREGEHGKAFAKRLLELGYAVRWPDSGRVEAKAAMACSSMTDREKFKAFGVGRKPGGPDVFDRMFEDKTLDPITGGLLGRYIAEERDSGRRLRAAREQLKA